MADSVGLAVVSYSENGVRSTRRFGSIQKPIIGFCKISLAKEIWEDGCGESIVLLADAGR